MKRSMIAVAALACVLAGPAVAQNVAANPTYGTYNLSGGFQPDPTNVNITSGGANDASKTIGNGCVGFVATAPDVRVNWTPGQLPLILSVDSQSDTTLVINDPAGNWICDDDGGNKGTNPSITLNGSRGGQYDIWIGSYVRNDMAGARLSISELSSY